MKRRALGLTGLSVSPVGLGTVKLGRTAKLKYPEPFALPSEAEASALIHGALDLGVNLIDVAPAYGLAEERVGRALRGRRDEVVLCTKAGEAFDEATGESRFDFSAEAIVASVERSLTRLQTDRVDVLLLHSDGRDVEAMEPGGREALLRLKQQGKACFVGLSGKTVAGAEAALKWADVLMVPRNAEDDAHRGVIREAHAKGVGVLVKKALASGRLDPASSLRAVLAEPGVSSAVVGTRSLDHLRANVAAIIRLP